MAALDLAVLLRRPGANVAVSDPRRPDGQREGERKLGAMIGLELTERKGETPEQLVEEVEAGMLIESAVEPEDPEARAVVQGGVLIAFMPIDLHHLDVHLDRVAGVGFLEQTEPPLQGTILHQHWTP